MDLSPYCCRPGDVREYLEQPFSIDDWTYATNGHIAVRIPRLAAVPENPAAPNGKKLFEKVPRTGDFFPLPAVDIPKPSEDGCRKCDGRGHEHDCPGCGCTCKECDGTGYPVEGANASVGIKGAVFNARYIAMLKKLPSVELAIAGPNDPMPFRFTGGEGLLMPMRSPRSNHIVAA